MSLREGLLNASSRLMFSSEPLQETADVTDDGQALKKIAKLTPRSWRERAVRRVRSGSTSRPSAGDAGLPGPYRRHPRRRRRVPWRLYPGHHREPGIPGALRFASAAAALKCTRFGGAFAAPQRAEVEELLSHGQPRTRPGPGNRGLS